MTRLPRVTFLATAALAGATATATGAGNPQPGSLEAGTLNLPAAPGSVRGLAQSAVVDGFTGQVGYQVPFELPAGPGGVRPSLALAYEGSLGNGPYGLGWGLSLPRVVRSTRLGVPSYTAADELEVVGLGKGGRLVAAGDGTFRVEGHGQALRVERPAGTDMIVITDADGVRYLLGTTPAARQMSGARVASWYVQTVEFPSGQTVQWTYESNGNQLYPTQATWGPRGELQARFGYEARPDAFTSQRTGFPVTTDRRLVTIAVWSLGALARTYTLGYNDAMTLSRLASVTLTGVGGEGGMPVVRFMYGSTEAATAAAWTGTGGWHLGMPDVTLMDVDGDGVGDLVRMDPVAGHSYRRNYAASGTPPRRSFAAPSPLPSDSGTAPALSAIRLMDIQGDTAPDLVRVVGNQWWVQRLVDGQWSTVGTWTNTIGVGLRASNLAFADLNGDDRPDVIQASPPGLVVRFNGDGGLGAPTTRPQVAATAALQPGQAGVVFRDFDGDGLADAALVRLTGIDVYPGRGDGTFGARSTISYPAGLTPASIYDIELADLNRDGVTDVVHVRGGSVSWYAARPSGTLLPARTLASPEPALADVVVAFADGNGNGSEDVLWSSPRGLWVLDLAGATNAGMITEIDNGLGRVQRFGYDASARLRLAAELDPALPDWAERLPISIPVAVRTDDLFTGVAPTRASQLVVRDGFWDPVEKRFGGFLVTTRTSLGASPADTLVETTTYHAGRGATDRVLRGSPLTVERRDGTGRLYDRVVTSWSALGVAGLTGPDPRLRLPVVTRRATITYEGVVPGVASDVGYAHDGDGNVVTETRNGRLDRTGDETVVTRSYATNTARWIRNRLVEEQVAETSGEVRSRHRTRYDGDAGGALAAGTIDLGRPRVREAWDGTGWIAQESFDYDAAGNPTRKVDHGVVRDLTYDADAMFVTTETVRPDPSTTLTWTAIWDPTRAVLTSVTDPNGVTRTLGYDGHGRLASEAVGAAPAHRTYSYQWAGPRPSTTTVEFDGVTGTRTTRHVYAGDGQRLYASTDLAGRTIIRDWVEPDARGQAAIVAEPFYGVAAPTALPANAPYTRHTRDALGRAFHVMRPDGSETTTTYEALAAIEHVGGTVPVRREFDGQGRMVRVVRTAAGVLEQLDVRPDAAGRITGFDLRGGTSVVRDEVQYDLLGRVTAADDPDQGARTYIYDDRDRLIGSDDADGRSVAYTYDDANRLLSAIGADGTAFRYHYDNPRVGSAAAARTRGRLAWVEEPTGVVDLTYDDLGRVASQTRTIDGVSASVTWTYSPNGLVRSASYDDGFVATYGYDGAGRLTSIGPSLWTMSSADAAGRPLVETAGNGVATTTARDGLGRSTRVAVTRAGGTLMDLELVRDGLGALVHVADRDVVGLDHLARYDHDDAGRLIGAVVGDFPTPWGGGIPYELGYAWDGLQNLTGVTVRTPPDLAAPALAAGSYGYAPDSRRLEEIVDGAATTRYQHDRTGRVTAAGKRALTWDDFGRLRSVEGDGADSTYAYGHDGARVYTRNSAGTERRFSPDDVRSPSGTRQHYLRVGGQVVARVDRTGATSAATFMHYGADAGPALITNGSGAVVEERLYEPFGAPLGDRIRADVTGGINHPIDPDTGWSDAGARWYAGDAARWTAPDPITRLPTADLLAAPWRLNPYLYGGANPTLFWDPDGREEYVIGVEPSPSRPGYCYTKVTTDQDGDTIAVERAAGLMNTELSPGRRVMSYAAAIESGSSTDKLLGGRITAVFHKAETAPGSAPGSALENVGFEISALEVAVEASVTSSQATLGAQASVVAGALSYATQDPTSSQDTVLRGGVSEGPGVALRLHYGDADGDGRREYGFGFDVGPASFDLKSERFEATVRDIALMFEVFARQPMVVY